MLQYENYNASVLPKYANIGASIDYEFERILDA